MHLCALRARRRAAALCRSHAGAIATTRRAARSTHACRDALSSREARQSLALIQFSCPTASRERQSSDDLRACARAHVDSPAQIRRDGRGREESDQPSRQVRATSLWCWSIFFKCLNRRHRTQSAGGVARARSEQGDGERERDVDERRGADDERRRGRRLGVALGEVCRAAVAHDHVDVLLLVRRCGTKRVNVVMFDRCNANKQKSSAQALSVKRSVKPSMNESPGLSVGAGVDAAAPARQRRATHVGRPAAHVCAPNLHDADVSPTLVISVHA